MGVITAAFIFYIVASWGWYWVEQWRGQKQVEQLTQSLKQWEEEQYQAALADTFGGKTPQETLQMYIAAVEKGDYELASRYLIENKREKEVVELRALAQKNNLVWYLDILKNVEPDDGILNDNFRMKSKTKEGPYYFVRFIKYPNGIWKIIEI